MTTIKQVRAFIAVAETQSFAEACGRVHLSQPALSIAIKNLEAELGGPLLVRTTRTLSLTPEGEDFLPVAKRLIHDWDDAIQDVHNHFALRQGKVTIAAMPSFACNLLPEVLAHYRQRYPSINITIQDVVAEQVVELVRSGRNEIGISFTPEESEDLNFTPLFDDKFVATLPAKSSLAAKKQLSWKDLLSENFIALQRPSSIRILLEKTLASQALELTVAFEAHQLATIGRMVANGLGVSAVPSLCQSQMEEMGAICRPLRRPSVVRQVGIITRRRYPLSVASSALFDVLKNYWSRG